MLTLPAPRRVAVIGGCRIPFARSNTAYADVSNQGMLTAVLQGLADRFDLHGLRLGEVAAGAVLKHSRDIALTRESLLSTTIGHDTPAYDVQQACGTGLEAAILVANKIALGQIEVGIAGGVDTTSDAPIALNEDFRRALLAANRAKTTPGRLKALASAGPTAPFRPEPPRNAEPRTGLSMGESCEQMAKRWGICREDQDALAVESHHRAERATAAGYFTSQITPIVLKSKKGDTLFANDEHFRSGVTMADMAKLRPAFAKENGTVTAGNASGINDAAAAVVLMDAATAKARGLQPLARLVAYAHAGVDPQYMGIGPVPATRLALQKAGLRIQDLDVIEANEAFAAQACAVSRDLGLDPAKVNPNGSGISLGHPIGATGALITVKALYELQRIQGRYALVTMCIGGGQGIAAIFERC